MYHHVAFEKGEKPVPFKENITMVGAGPTGSMLAIFLARRGFSVDLYEKRSDLRITKSAPGRSINLAISVRGIHALEQVGIWEKIQNIAIPMSGRMIHPIEGDLSFQPYGQKREEVIYSISREKLNMALMNLAEKEQGVNFHFSTQCTGLDLPSGLLQIRNNISKKTTSLRTSRIIGVDGSASAVRNCMMNVAGFDFSHWYLDHGYQELTIPSKPDKSFQMSPNALHIWPRGNYMLIALPNMNGSFTCTLFLPHEGKNSFDSLVTPSGVNTFFSKNFPDAMNLIPNLETLLSKNRRGSLVTLKCYPWHFQDKIILLGDAAHAIVPFFGQGMNSAFEDCVILDKYIETYWPDWTHIFKLFSQNRKKNTDAIADMALNNYVEMRDLVNDPDFLFRQKIGFLLERKFPDIFIPRYSMVSFHRIPYFEALRRGEIQDDILKEVCTTITSEDQIDWVKTECLVKERLTSTE